MKKYSILKSYMLSKDFGIALLDTSKDFIKHLPKTKRFFYGECFIQNAAIINSKMEVESFLTIKPKTRMESCFVQIEIEQDNVFLVDFRGDRYLLDRDGMTATYVDSYKKY
ncbi:hypothetical protein ABWI01_05845 [Oceanicaulis alexandrii]|uniref:hypothetical protein n=1 Tax=Oceanicaulis alexandrii TaxID=153233 RepID=UPI0035CF3BFA